MNYLCQPDKTLQPSLYDSRVYDIMHHSKLGKLQLNHLCTSSATAFDKPFHPIPCGLHGIL